MIEDSPTLKMDGAICKLLGKTPSQIYELEEQGYLSYDEKLFLWAYSWWEIKFALENRISLI